MSRSICLAIVSAIVFTGCSSSNDDAPTIAPASGVVTLDDIPLPDANVTFHPSGDGVAATGETDKDGKFTLKTNGKDGATIGKHHVIVLTAIPPPMPGTPEAKNPIKDPIPSIYGDVETSGLTAEVKAGPENTFKFELKTE